MPEIIACQFCGEYHRDDIHCTEVDMEEEFLKTLEQRERDLDNYLDSLE